MVITRYLFKPTAAEGLTRFNDNKRLHIFVVDVATRTARQLTNGPYYEHSINWSPKGDQILFVSNREANADKVFNYDIFTVTARDGIVKRLTSTRSAEYEPVWSPDGTRIAFSGTTRELTSSETTKEDTHVWVMRADGSAKIEVGQSIDNRQGPPQWSPRRAAALLHPAGTRPRAARVAAGARQHHSSRGRRRGADLRSHSPAAGGRADPGRQSTRQCERVLGGQGQAGLCLHLTGLARGAVRHRRGDAGRHGGRAGHAVDRAQQGAARQPPDCPGRGHQLHERGLHGGGVPHPSRHRRHHEAGHGAADRDDPRRAARPAGPGLQPQGAGLCRPRLGVADGQLPRFDRLRAEVRGRHLPRPERRRGARRARRRGRGAGEVSLARRQPPGHRRRQLWRAADQLDRHADASLQGGRAERGHLEPGHAELPRLLPRLPGGGVRRASRTSAPAATRRSA